jgi:hypothetical protein
MFNITMRALPDYELKQRKENKDKTFSYLQWTLQMKHNIKYKNHKLININKKSGY